MSETNERCENCKYFEPTDAKSGTCENQSISREGEFGPCESWPKVRKSFYCGFFEASIN